MIGGIPMTQQRAPEALRHAFALRETQGDRKALVDWASSYLEAGFDSPSLQILAGLNPSTEQDEIDLFTDRVVAEFQWEQPQRRDVTSEFFLNQVRQVLQQIVRQEVSARNGCATLWRLHDLLETSLEEDDPRTGELRTFIQDDDRFDLAEQGIGCSVAERETDIRRQAAKFLEDYPAIGR